jgi:hypothetical protein
VHELAHGHAEEQPLGQDRPQPVCTPVSVRSFVKSREAHAKKPHSCGGWSTAHESRPRRKVVSGMETASTQSIMLCSHRNRAAKKWRIHLQSEYSAYTVHWREMVP